MRTKLSLDVLHKALHDQELARSELLGTVLFVQASEHVLNEKRLSAERYIGDAKDEMDSLRSAYRSFSSRFGFRTAVGEDV